MLTQIQRCFVEGEISDHPDLVFMMFLFFGVCLAAWPSARFGEELF